MDDYDKLGWMGRHMSAATHCEVIRRVLSEYLDGALTPEQRGGCEAHLAACRACRTELAGLRTMLESLRTLPEANAPDLVPGVRRKLAARRAPAAAPAWTDRLALALNRALSSAVLRPVALGATAILVVVVVATLPRPTDERTDAVPGERRQLAAVPEAPAPSLPASQPVSKVAEAPLAKNGLMADAKKEKAPEFQAPIREYNRRAKPVEEAFRANATRDESNELDRQLAENKAASMEQAIEGALSARGRVGARRFEADAPAQEKGDKLASAAAPAAAVGGAAGVLPPLASPAGAKDGGEPVNRYQWDVPDFTQASMLMQQWVQARQGLVVPVDQRTFVVTIPPAAVPEFTRQFSSRIVSTAPVQPGKASEDAEAETEPFVMIWIELIRSK